MWPAMHLHPAYSGLGALSSLAVEKELSWLTAGMAGTGNHLTADNLPFRRCKRACSSTPRRDEEERAIGCIMK